MRVNAYRVQPLTKIDKARRKTAPAEIVALSEYKFAREMNKFKITNVGTGRRVVKRLDLGKPITYAQIIPFFGGLIVAGNLLANWVVR